MYRNIQVLSAHVKRADLKKRNICNVITVVVVVALNECAFISREYVVWILMRFSNFHFLLSLLFPNTCKGV